MTAILPPLFLQVALSFVILFGVAGFRIIPALRDRKMAAEAAKGRKDIFVPRANLFVDNLQNQFEVPVLFYVAVLLAIAAGQPISDGFVTLAWVFVISRIFHALVHVTINFVMLRLAIFVFGFVTVIAMWISLYNQLMAG